MWGMTYRSTKTCNNPANWRWVTQYHGVVHPFPYCKWYLIRWSHCIELLSVFYLRLDHSTLNSKCNDEVEEPWRKLDQLKLVRQRDHSVLTKLTIPELNQVSQVKIIYEQLNDIIKVFNKVKRKIAALYPEEDIEWEIYNSESIIAKIIIEAKWKIDIGWDCSPGLPPSVDDLVTYQS